MSLYPLTLPNPLPADLPAAYVRSTILRLAVGNGLPREMVSILLETLSSAGSGGGSSGPAGASSSGALC